MLRFALLLALSGAALSGPALAAASPVAEPWLAEPFSADAATLVAAAAAVPPPAGADVHQLLEDHSYTFDDAGRLVHRWRVVYRVLTPAGTRSWAAVSAMWEPWHQDRPELRARVITADGREHWLDPASLSEEPAAESSLDVYSDRRVLSAPLPAVAVGALVEETGESRDREPFFAAGGVWVHFLVDGAPTRLHRLELSAPTSLPLRYGSRLLDGLEPVRTVADGRVRLLFERRDVEPYRTPEPDLPPWQPRWPQVAFSTAESWQQVASAYSDIVDRQIAAADLAPWAEPPPAAASIAERAQEYLDRIHRDIRYTGLELGEASLVPATPAQVHARRYGDCKDQASLLVALLRADGVPAYVALLRAGDTRDVDSQLPGLGRFDHAIVFVPGADPIWIDPTDPHSPAGTLPPPAQDRWALVAAPSTVELVRTRAEIGLGNRDVETREVFLADFGPSRIVETTEYHGAIASARRGYHEGSSRQDRVDGYREYLAAEYLATDLGAVAETGADEPTAPYRLELEALAAGRAVTDLDNAVVAVPLAGGLLGRLPEALLAAPETPRQDDFYFHEPFVSERRYVIHPPAGLRLRQLPEAVDREIGSGRYTRSFHQEDDGTLHGLLRFESGPRLVTAADFAAYVDAVLELDEAEPLMIWFDDPARVAVAEGRPIEAVAHYRALIAREPTVGLHRVRFARVLLGLGMGGEARRQARRGVELAPDLPEAHWNLGWILQHDELGSLRAGDWDREGALAALDRGLEIASPGHVLELEKAILLEYDERGLRYRETDALVAAVELYDRWLAENDDPDFELSRLLALYFAGRHQEVLERTDGRSDLQMASLVLRLAARAVIDGAGAIEAEAEALASDRERRQELLTGAAQRLMQWRHYPQAAAAFRLAARGSESAAQVLGLARLLEKARRFDQLELDPDRPEDVVRQMFGLLADPATAPDMLELLHPSVRDRESEELATSVRQVERAIGRVEGMDPVAAMELGIGTMEASVEGDAERGYRVQLTSVLDGAVVVVYATADGERPLVVATSDALVRLALEVRRRLAAEDLTGARQWLDWARRDRRPPSHADDPYVASAFHLLWPESSADLDATRAELAVDAILAQAPIAPDELDEELREHLEAALPRLAAAAAATDDARLRAGLEAAQLDALRTLKRHAERVELARRLLASTPQSVLLSVHLYEALLLDERDAELVELATRDLAGDTAVSLFARRQLLQHGVEEGDFPEVVRHVAKLRELGKASASDLNALAWSALFVPGEEALALDEAEEAAQRSEYAERAVLHTLATAYAWNGRPLDAMRVLQQCFALRNGSDELEVWSDDWLVAGRVAEDYGLYDTAADYYRRIEKPERDFATSSYQLALKRLAELEARSRAAAR